MFKDPAEPTTKQRRRKKASQRERIEKQMMLSVRAEDGRCRFPRCPCTSFGWKTEVAHTQHRGMGGDPTTEASLPSKMLLLCWWRHQASPWSIDGKGGKGITLRPVALTGEGMRGPVAWDVKWSELPADLWRTPREGKAFTLGMLSLRVVDEPEWARIFTPRLPLTRWQARVFEFLNEEAEGRALGRPKRMEWR